MKLRNKDADTALLARYVAGECCKRGRAEVEALVAVDDEKSRLLKEIQRLFEQPPGTEPEIDIDAAWNEMDRRLKSTRSVPSARVFRLRSSTLYEDRQAEDRARREVNDRSRQRKVAYRRDMVRIAVVLFAVVIGAVVAGRYSTTVEKPPSNVKERVYATAKGQRMQVRLSDGSEILLNVASQLIVPASFGEENREVELEGEGYFEVAHDERLPFRISAGDARVEVLGTSFNVRSNEAEAETQVVVAEGRVSVSPAPGGAADTVLLKSSQMASLSREGHLAVLRHIDIQRYLAWTEGRLLFDNASLEAVAAQLEAWYDLEIEIPHEGVGATFNGSFEDEPLSEILNTVAATLGLDFKRDKRHITFYSARP